MRLTAPLIFLLIAGCAAVATRIQLDDRFGRADPARFDAAPAAVAGSPDYWKEVRPILDARCVACHACYDAPCQLNLASYAGITRGANADPVYSVTRVLAADPTRLGFDALSNADWRKKGFFPVLNERAQTPEANREGGVMYRLLALKQAHPGPDRGPLHNPDLDFSLDREQTCVRAEDLDDYTRRHPARGMPFGLPALDHGEQQTLARWLEQGAPYSQPAALPAAALRGVADWERFLNADGLREQLVARYIYEHWFAGHLYFATAPGHYFQLVRSRTPPGAPIDLVATRRPYDDPGTPRVFYRLRPLDSTPVAKTFMPLKLDGARLERLQKLFLQPAWQVARLPGYEPETASNPFATFRDLPPDARYRFMLDDARFIMMGFMKGPVCRGQVALNVITDQFWVFFASPDRIDPRRLSELLDRDAPNLQLPAEHQSTAGLLAWRDYAELEQRHMRFKESIQAESRRPDLDMLWDGGGNPDAALTVFRHFDSASVVRGLAGERPQTAIVIGYPLFERMHYLLLAGFDVFGNVGHQLATRLYMDFLRMEGELDFVSLLPRASRQQVIDYWYRSAGQRHGAYLAEAGARVPLESAVTYRTADPLDELYQALQRRYARLRDPALDWRAKDAPDAAAVVQLKKLSSIRGAAASVMPEMSLLLIRRAGADPAVVSLLRNSAHSNVAHLYNEDARRLPGEDTLLALDGVAGAYPNALFVVDPSELPDFTTAVARLVEPTDLTALVDRYGIRRTDHRFWPLSDAIRAAWRQRSPEDAAVLDYSRFEDL